jgi:peroxiredoxin
LAEGELWQETLCLSQTPSFEKTDSVKGQAEWLQAVGRAHFRLGNDQQAEPFRKELETLLCQNLSARERQVWLARHEAHQAQKSESEVQAAEQHTRQELDNEIKALEAALSELNAYRAMADGHVTQAIQLLEKKQDADPALLARWRLQGCPSPADRDKALDALRQHVESHAQETLPLANLAWLQWEAGQTDCAAATLAQLRKLSTEIDLQAPPFSRLAPIVAQLGWPCDWRIHTPSPEDVGQRPPLESLGPVHWQPTAAPDWTLSDALGRSVSLADYRGRPVILVFYLGWGCLHCAQQLQALGPRTEDFRQAGIELLAISSDDQEGLKKSLAAYEGEFPFPLLADDALQVFRLYRVFDDFEERPLHGTFLIDGAGRMRWHDISFEPFMDVEFVLTEARRLLAQSANQGDCAATPFAGAAAEATATTPSTAKVP